MRDKCERGNEIAPIRHACLTSCYTCAKGVQFYCPSRTYAAIPYCTIFPFLEHCEKEEDRTIRYLYILMEHKQLFLNNFKMNSV